MADQATTEAAAQLLRTQQAETIVRIMGSRIGARQRYLLCGDMNDTPDSSALVAYEKAGLVSALTAPAEVGTVQTTVELPASPAWTSTFKEIKGQPRSFDLIDQETGCRRRWRQG